jgi:hypothetical protein
MRSLDPNDPTLANISPAAKDIHWPSEACGTNALFIESQLLILRGFKERGKANNWEFWETPAWETQMSPVARAIELIAEAVDFPAGKIKFRPNSRFDELQILWWSISRYLAHFPESDAQIGQWPTRQCGIDAMYVESELHYWLPYLMRWLGSKWDGARYQFMPHWRDDMWPVAKAINRVASAIGYPTKYQFHEETEYEALVNAWRQVSAYAAHL